MAAVRRAKACPLLLALACVALTIYYNRRPVTSAAEEPAKAEGAAAALPVAFLGGEAGKTKKAMLAAFPNAVKGSKAFSTVIKTVKKYGFTRSNVIYGTSISSDEISSDAGHLTSLLSTFYGRTFPMGGLAGIPFSGKAGYEAMTKHTPEDGHVFLVFGPQIGYSPDGQAGKFMRKGQGFNSASCGAINLAYQQVKSGAKFPADVSDLQQTWLREKLRPFVPAAQASEEPAVSLVMDTYKLIEEEVLAIANTNYGPGNLVLLGGIMINMPYPAPAYFMPIHFSVRSATLTPPMDLMSVFAQPYAEE